MNALHDLKFALRSAARAPLFSLLAVVTLALGIGANAALLAVVKPVLLDPLPYAEQDRLVRIFAHNQEAGEDRWGFSAGMVDDLQRTQRSFSGTAAFFSFPQEVVVGGAERPLVGSTLLVEPALFDILGVSPFDPVTLAAAAAVLVGAAVIALLAPVRKATSVDPMQVLGSE